MCMRACVRKRVCERVRATVRACVCLCLSVRLSFCPDIGLFSCLYIGLSFHRSVRGLFISLPVCRFTCQSLYLSSYLSISVSI